MGSAFLESAKTAYPAFENKETSSNPIPRLVPVMITVLLGFISYCIDAKIIKSAQTVGLTFFLNDILEKLYSTTKSSTTNTSNQKI